MNETEGVIFSIADSNSIVPGCTVSKCIYDTQTFGISYFTMAEDTDISAESYPYHKIILPARGDLVMYCMGHEWILHQGEGFITPIDLPVGIRTQTGGVFTEIRLMEGVSVNKAITDGEIFRLSELVPYQEGRIVSMDIIKDSVLKFAVMAFDAGTGLSEHSAPGEALIFALDGEGVIGYEGTEHTIRAGENFKFAKNGRHYVKAYDRFKMALLLTLED